MVPRNSLFRYCLHSIPVPRFCYCKLGYGARCSSSHPSSRHNLYLNIMIYCILILNKNCTYI